MIVYELVPHCDRRLDEGRVRLAALISGWPLANAALSSSCNIQDKILQLGEDDLFRVGMCPIQLQSTHR